MSFVSCLPSRPSHALVSDSATRPIHRELPFGFNGTDKDKALTTFQTNLKTLHEAGVTVTLTMGSWCTQLPVHQEDEWTPDQFEEFVDYFRVIQETVFGGALDGIDFDW